MLVAGMTITTVGKAMTTVNKAITTKSPGFTIIRLVKPRAVPIVLSHLFLKRRNDVNEMLWYPGQFFSPKPTLRESEVHRNVYPQVFDVPNAGLHQTNPSKIRNSLRPPKIYQSTSRLPSSWTTDPYGNSATYIGNHVENQGEFEFDLEAQAMVPAVKQLLFLVDVPGHYTIDHQGRHKETEPLPPNTTPPPTPAMHATNLRTPSPQLLEPQEYQRTHDYDNQRFSGPLIFSNHPSSDEAPTEMHCPIHPHSMESKEILQPQPVRPIRFDIMSIFKGELVLPNSHEIRIVPSQRFTYSDFLRRKQEIEERITSKHNYRPLPKGPSYSPHWTQSTINEVAPPLYDQRRGSQVSENPHTGDVSGHYENEVCRNNLRSGPSCRHSIYKADIPENYVRPELRPPTASETPIEIDIRTPTPDLRQSQRHRSPSSHLPPTFPPTSYGAFHCLHLINDILHRMDFLSLDPHLDDLKKALKTAQICLRRQRTIPHDIWNERHETWTTVFDYRIDFLRRFIILNLSLHVAI
ncbi:hypothetical protein E4T56_gene16854 [Termitomyces sp. T112]|nr:hypothetical protein E4T56_gene16854 [Termitomyces sp. T112]